jgi:hypothetical protein
MKDAHNITALCFATAALVVTLALPSSARPEAKSTPSVILTVNGPINAFAMDGARFVYSGGRARDIGGCPTVELGSFGSKVRKRLAAEVLGAPAVDACDAFPLLIALAGTRAVWGGFLDCCIGGFGSVTTAAPGSKPRDLDGIGQTYHGTDGDFLTGIGGDRNQLVYAIVTVSVVRNLDGCFPPADPPPDPQTCDFKVTKWKVRRVVGARAVTIRNAPPAALIATSRGAVMVVPADRSVATCGESGNCAGSEPRALHGFEIRSSGGSLLMSKNLAATPAAIALSDRFVAVLTRSGGKTQIERYSRHTGRLIGRTSVPATTANELVMSDAKIVYHVRRSISLLDARSGAHVLLAVAKANPIGLGIEGSRVAWAENFKNRGRIMSLMSPT